MPGGDCSGLDGGGIGDWCFCWLVWLLIGIVKVVGVLRIWLRSIHISCMLAIIILIEIVC